MAVGDSVGALSNDNTALIFQPASGVECMITAFSADGNSANPPIQFQTAVANSIILSNFVVATNLSHVLSNGNLKLFITNAFYIRLQPLGVGYRSAYTGIQIK